jgi:hypothetical protein
LFPLRPIGVVFCGVNPHRRYAFKAKPAAPSLFTAAARALPAEKIPHLPGEIHDRASRARLA